jgi:hypothetical protein
VFTLHGANGIMSYYEEKQEELEIKERDEVLTEDEVAVVHLARYIAQFKEGARDDITYIFWKDYRYNLTKDKRLQLLLEADLSTSLDAGDRKRRFDVAFAEGRQVNERIGSVVSACVPQFQRGGVYNLAKPMFDLIRLLGIDIKNNQFNTCSEQIKTKSVEITSALMNARALVKEWTDGELPPNPSYKQLIGFTGRMLDSLIGGKLESNGYIQVATGVTVEVKDDRRPNGKTTRKRQKKVAQYILEFPPTGDDGLSALNRVDMLKTLDL